MPACRPSVCPSVHRHNHHTTTCEESDSALLVNTQARTTTRSRFLTATATSADTTGSGTGCAMTAATACPTSTANRTCATRQTVVPSAKFIICKRSGVHKTACSTYRFTQRSADCCLDPSLPPASLDFNGAGSCRLRPKFRFTVDSARWSARWSSRTLSSLECS